MTRETLHRLVEELPDSELPTAARILLALRVASDALRSALDEAPIDDEPETEEERAAVAEALREIEEGVPGVPHGELERRWVRR